MRAARLATAVVLALTTAGCPMEFERQSELRRVRVLALRADPAELAVAPDVASPPLPVRFTALTVAPDGRSVTVEYALCLPGNVYAPDFDCPGEEGVPLAGGVLDVLDPALLGLGTSLLPDPNTPEGRDALTRGVPLAVGYRASDGTPGAEGEERGTRRLTLRLTDAPNQNPALDDVVLEDGSPLPDVLAPDTEYVLRPVLREGSLERYTAADGTPRTEAVSYSWHATGEGQVEDFRSLEPVDDQPGDPTTRYRTPKEPGPVTLYVVARDGRGGTAWQVRTLNVGP